MARLFDATTEKLTQASPPDPPAAGSVSLLWLPSVAADSGSTFRLWEYGGSGKELTILRFSTTRTWFAGWNGFGGDDRATAAAAGSYTSGQWTHVVVRWDAARSPHTELLIDDVSIATATGTLSTGGTFTQHTIGNSFFSDNVTTPGTISDVALFSAWLEDGQVTALHRMASPLAVAPGALVRYDRLTGVGSAEKDSISGQTLTVTGATQAESPLVSLGSPTFVTREAAVGGTTIPIFAHHYNQMRAA